MPTSTPSGLAPDPSWVALPEISQSTLSANLAPFSAAPTNLRAVTFSVEGQTIRYRQDNQAATTTTGVPLPTGTYYEEMTQKRAIRVRVIESSASATMRIQYWVQP